MRRARLEAGLSLAQVVAGTDINRQTVYLVEQGRMRPSLEVLQQIARRTGKPVTYFLGERVVDAEPTASMRRIQSGLTQLERHLLVRDFAAAVELGERLLQSAVDSASEASVRVALGQALDMLRRPEDALPHLERALELAEGLSDPWGAIDALDWIGMAQYLLDEPKALATLTDALERCRKLQPVFAPSLVRILSHIGTVHISRHAMRAAIRAFEEAAAAAETVRDIAQLARMYDNLSQAYSQLLQPAKALALANKALHYYEMERDLAGVYRAENNLGDLLLRDGDLAAAEKHLARALRGFSELGVDRRGRGYVLVNIGELALRRGDLDAAEEVLTEALTLGTSIGERVVQANAHAWLAVAHERRGAPGRADREFLAAIAILAELEMPDRLREAHLAYGRMLKTRGDLARAIEHIEEAAALTQHVSFDLPARIDEPLVSDSAAV